MRGRTGWLGWPAAATAVFLVYVLLAGDLQRSALGSLTSLVTSVLAVVIVRRRRPADARLWYVLVGGLIVWAVGDLITLYHAAVLHALPFPSWADACYLGAYPLLIGGLFGLSRPPRQRSLAGLLDFAVIVTGVGLVYWVFVIAPIADEPGMPELVRLVLMAYPTTGLLQIAVTLPMVLRVGGRSPTLWLLTMCSLAGMLGNAGYSFLPPDSFLADVSLGLFLFAYICIPGAARYAPTTPIETDELTQERFGRARLMLLGVSTLPVPVVLLLQGLREPAHVSWLPVAAGSILLFALVLARLSGFVATVQLQSRQLKDLAMRDDLTGLPNRRRFELRLREAMAGGQVQLALLDLNRFKDVNDRFGHATGDRMLAVVGARLAGAVRHADLVARLGGDEFAVIVRNADPPAMDGTIERLLAVLRRPVEVDGHEMLMTAAVGSAGNEGTEDPYEVLRRADVAMYVAKASTERGHLRYLPQMDQDAGEQARLGAEMRTALDEGQFRVFYQPIVSLPEGRIVSVEALVRWDHPVRGFVSPAEFISVAEQNGLIVELGEWILRESCAQAVAWRDAYGEKAPQRMSVNVSARQLAEPRFPELVASVLASSGLPAAGLVVEVTETAVFGGGRTVQAVNEIHALGVRIALDDFGTGHSSLTLLQTVPVDILKVDKSFVDNITMAGRHAVIATALIMVSDGLGLMAVAEGVETAEQAAELHRLGYRLAQGYYFGKPSPEPEFDAVNEAVRPGSAVRPGR
ncbi:EAL domain-containing protein [Actinoplanes bogorensis]|uniref:EAL domain-containing protein n=1 Tax=Paractinoplanes bogorensis TaxID=1610840 RepID=A0ABS5YFC5_9ACTN|nr:EAL domain-containing protein [Actinoplanes bogorensis]MBU2662154.1 EAL domain-containing protein [Actinoplanes bogorensis]